MLLNLAALILWLGVIGLCLHFGRGAASWIEGAGRWWVAAGLVAAGLVALAGGLAVLKRLPAQRRRLAGMALAGAAVGLALAAWHQGAFIERTHLLLYGVLGVLCLGVTRRLAPGGWALYWAVVLAAGLGAADELVQHLHPQRVGDPADAVANAAAAGLCAMAAWALWPPAMQNAQRPGRAVWALIAFLVVAGLLALLYGISP